jgi:hypothetical protein
MPLAPCPACARHVRVTESQCPFCDTALALEAERPLANSALRLGRAAMFVFRTSAAAAMVATAAGCGGGSTPPPTESIAQPYGAPPDPQPPQPPPPPPSGPQLPTPPDTTIMQPYGAPPNPPEPPPPPPTTAPPHHHTQTTTTEPADPLVPSVPDDPNSMTEILRREQEHGLPGGGGAQGYGGPPDRFGPGEGL